MMLSADNRHATMGRLQYQPPAGANYQLARLIAGETDSYERSIATLIDQRSEQTQRIPGAEWLPRESLGNMGLRSF